MINEKSIDFKPLNKILELFSNISSSDLIPILQEIQLEYGYLPQPVIQEMNRKTGIPLNRIFGVATFYEQFHLEPHGRHTIRCCRGTACHVKGGSDVINAVKRHLGIEPGETTKDMRYTFETVACLGTCFLAPVMMVNNDYYGRLTAHKIKNIIDEYA